MKTCFKCGAEQPLSEFYAHPMMRDGHLNKCKTCTKSDVRARAQAKKPQIREYLREKQRTPEYVAKRQAYLRTDAGKAMMARARAKYAAMYPERRAAHVAVGNAIKQGLLTKQPCEVCGCEQSEAHHDDYSKQLDVRWLCTRHHKEHHREQVA